MQAKPKHTCNAFLVVYLGTLLLPSAKSSIFISVLNFSFCECRSLVPSVVVLSLRRINQKLVCYVC